jgi:hypothetical protein
MRRRPVLVTIISCVLILSGVAGLAFHAGDFRGAPKLDFLLVSIVRALAIVGGVFMLRGSNWARWLAMIWIAFHVIISAFHPVQELVIHMVVFAVFAFALFRRNASKFFRASRAA